MKWCSLCAALTENLHAVRKPNQNFVIKRDNLQFEGSISRGFILEYLFCELLFHIIKYGCMEGNFFLNNHPSNQSYPLYIDTLFYKTMIQKFIGMPFTICVK